MSVPRTEAILRSGANLRSGAIPRLETIPKRAQWKKALDSVNKRVGSVKCRGHGTSERRTDDGRCANSILCPVPWE